MKLLFLFIALIVVIGVGLFVVSDQKEPLSLSNLPEKQTQTLKSNQEETFEISEQLAQNILKNALEARFDAETATYTLTNLDRKGGPELLIGAAERTQDPFARPRAATIQVLTVLNQEGEYENRGRVEYQELLHDVPTVKELEDITSDGIPELFFSLGFGGASNVAHGFLNFETQEKKLTWIQLQEKQGQTRDAIFLLGGTVTHTEDIQVSDVSGDGNKEIVELLTRSWEPSESEQEIPYAKKGDTWCLVRVWQWTGFSFAFAKTLSEQFLQKLGSDCAM